MYKQPTKSTAELEQHKKDLINKIINGSHLDAVGMQHLQNALRKVESDINEAKEREATNV